MQWLLSNRLGQVLFAKGGAGVLWWFLKQWLSGAVVAQTGWKQLQLHVCQTSREATDSNLIENKKITRDPCINLRGWEVW